MRHLLAVAALLCGLSVPAQGTEWVANGSFTGTLAPWTMGGGYSVNPGLDATFDTTGMGVSDSFGCSAGGQVTPAPYPPNTIEQTILMIQGLTYEFRADAAGSRQNAPTVNNADIGTIWVEVDNVEVARHAFANYTNNGLPGGEIKRAQIVGRFTPATTGNVTLRISFQRAYLANTGTPRVNLDNVSIRDVVGPTYWIRGNRKLGTNVTHELRGAPNALFGTFVALGENPTGAPFPGVSGLFHLDFATTVTLALGLTDANGEASYPVAIPNDPMFLSMPLYYQAGSWSTQIELGYHFGVVCTQ
jgi:hypothetical protein